MNAKLSMIEKFNWVPQALTYKGIRQLSTEMVYLSMFKDNLQDWINIEAQEFTKLMEQRERDKRRRSRGLMLAPLAEVDSDKEEVNGFGPLKHGLVSAMADTTESDGNELRPLRPHHGGSVMGNNYTSRAPDSLLQKLTGDEVRVAEKGKKRTKRRHSRHAIDLSDESDDDMLPAEGASLINSAGAWRPLDKPLGAVPPATPGAATTAEAASREGVLLPGLLDPTPIAAVDAQGSASTAPGRAVGLSNIAPHVNGTSTAQPAAATDASAAQQKVAALPAALRSGAVPADASGNPVTIPLPGTTAAAAAAGLVRVENMDLYPDYDSSGLD